MEQIQIEQELQALRERNKKVEAEKAWEGSITRRTAIAIGTYAVALIWLLWIGESEAWLKAVVPAVGYVLSTLSLPIIKNRWISGNFN